MQQHRSELHAKTEARVEGVLLEASRQSSIDQRGPGLGRMRGHCALGKGRVRDVLLEAPRMLSRAERDLRWR